MKYISKIRVHYHQHILADLAKEADAAPPTNEIKNSVFYHGTPTKERADKIWKQGLKANISDIPEHWVSHPVEDHV